MNEETPMVCTSCGASPVGPAEVEQARLTWSYGTERGRPVWTCPACARRFARSIEGKLDSEWW